MKKERLHQIIFGSEDRAGRAFDIVLIVAIIISIIAVMLESVDSLEERYGTYLFGLEIMFTVLFTIEYLVRVFISERPIKYMTSAFGIIDLISILPTYLAFIVPGAQIMMTVRGLRLMRIFRVLKLAGMLSEANYLARAIEASRRKIFVFFLGVSVLIIISGSLIYAIEGKEGGFDNIFVGCYWSAVTITTLGYGDIVATSVAGKALATLMAVIGFACISVPGGILTVSFVQMEKDKISTEACRSCGRDGHASDAIHCKYCGFVLDDNEEDDG